MRIDGSGNVGIGNSSPSAPLDVTGNAKVSGTLTVGGNIELGHASDTTLSRSAAGKLAVEGVDVVLATGNQTIAGNKTLSGQTELTGQAATNSTSAMSRDLVKMEMFYDIGRIWKSNDVNFFVNSGAGSAAQNGFLSWLYMVSGTANNGYGLSIISTGVNRVTAMSGSGIDFSRKIGVSFNFHLAMGAFTDIGVVYRFVVGSNAAAAPDGTAPVAHKALGVELKSRGSSHDWRLFAHDGSAITYSSWTDTGWGTGVFGEEKRKLYIISDGAGSVTGGVAPASQRVYTNTLTISGAPTTVGASGQQYLTAEVANSASGTTSGTFFVFDHLILTE